MHCFVALLILLCGSHVCVFVPLAGVKSSVLDLDVDVNADIVSSPGQLALCVLCVHYLLCTLQLIQQAVLVTLNRSLIRKYQEICEVQSYSKQRV